MILENREIVLENKRVTAEIQIFENSDWAKIKKIYELWVELSDLSSDMKSRRINIPEVISEGIFCLEFQCARFIKSSGTISKSFDCLDLNLLRRIQIKASSVEEDMTTFGPKTVWDDLYFIHFLPNGVLDGSYSVYKIDNDAIYNHKVNKNTTFRQQQAKGRRPRFSLLKHIIIPNGVLPFKSGNIFDEAQASLKT